VIPGADRITRDAALTIVVARQREETDAMMRRHAEERAPLEMALADLAARHQAEMVALTRQFIRDRDLLDTMASS